MNEPNNNEMPETTTTTADGTASLYSALQAFQLTPWEIDGTPRAKDGIWEMGVNLCPGSGKLICAYPEQGLGRK
jgi:hypothetical protein